MSSAAVEFPVEEFLQCIRNNRRNSDRFIGQVKNLNTSWIYEIVKHSHNSILQMKELPATKLNALLLIKDLMETCEIPCINLIEVYILPIVYQIAIEKPHEKNEKRGSTYFQQIFKNAKIPNIEETGIRFISLCSQIIAAGSVIKPKRLFQNQELNQKSEFCDYYEKYLKYGISGTYNQLINFSSQFKEKGRDRFLRNLQKFNQANCDYGEYFVTKIIQSVQSDTNPLLNLGAQSMSSISNQLDMRKLLKHGDPTITSPLIDQLILKMSNIPSFMAKKNCLSLLTDFVKWGDVQAFVKLCYEGSLETIGFRIASVNGSKGLIQGENIYEQVKGQRDGKRKFYTQYLKSIEIISKCLQNQKLQIQQSEKIQQLYRYFSKDKKFQFPQNLMAKRIENDFKQNLQYNEQRNIKITKLIKQKNQLQRKDINKVGNSSAINLEQITDNLQKCLKEIFKVTLKEEQIDKRMTNVIKLKTRCEEQIEMLDQNQDLPEDQVYYILENGQQILKTVEQLQVLHSEYKNKTINFNEFQKRHTSLTNNFELDQSLSHSVSADRNMKQKTENLKNSEEVINSFKLNKSNNNVASHSNIGAKIMENSNNILLKTMQQRQKGDTNPYKKGIKTADNFQNYSNEDQVKQTQSVDPRYTARQSEEQVLNQVTSSILSDKKVMKIPMKKQSKISQSNNESNSVKSSKLKQKIKIKNEKLSKLRQGQASEKVECNMKSQLQSQNNQQPSAAFMKTSQSQMQKMISNGNSKMSNISNRQYYSPQIMQAINVPRTAPNFYIKNQQPNSNSNIFIATSPIEIGNKNSQLSDKVNKEKQGQLISYQSGGNQYQVVTYAQHHIQSQNNGSSKQSRNEKTHKKGIQITSGLAMSENSRMRNQKESKKFIDSNGFRGLPQKYQPELKTQALKQQENKLYNMYKADRLVSSNRQDHESKGPDQSSSNKNSIIKRQIFDSKLSSKSSFNSPVNNSNMLKKQGENQRQIDKSNQEYYSVKNQSFSNSLKIKQHPYNYMNAIYSDQEDFIREPSLKPLDKSYYSPRDIEKQVKNSLKPQFRQCFQIEKELIRSPRQKIISYDLVKQRFQVKKQNLTLKPHQEYLISKIRKQYQKESDLQTKQLTNNILRLKANNSRLRHQKERKQLEPSKYSESRSSDKQYSQCVSFSRSKQHSDSSSPYKFRSNQNELNGKSRISEIVAQGQLIIESDYSRLLSELNNDKLKKACLKNKCVLYRSDIWEIGSMFKQSPSSTSLTLYLTSSCRVTDFHYSISKQPNLQIQCLSKGYKEIWQNKQIKIELDCKIKSINYNLPIINISFVKGKEQKNISFYLPLTFNKFVTFSEVDSLKIDGKKYEKIRRSVQFEANRKIVKTSNLIEYLPFVNLLQQNMSRSRTYGAKCCHREQRLDLLIRTKGDRIILQALIEKERQQQTGEYLIYTLKKILSD